MRTRQIIAFVLALAMAGGAVPATVFAGQNTASLGGTAKDAAKKPYTDYSIRARNVQQGLIASTTRLDASGNFALNGLQPATYLIELISQNGKVVCTEGPFNVSQAPNLAKDNVVIDCNHVPAAWWLLGAAAAAGITAGVVQAGPASAAQ